MAMACLPLWLNMATSRCILIHRQPYCYQRLVRLISQDSSKVKRTCLYDFHISQGGKMVPFAGYEMPIQYGNHSISDSHIHTRNHVSIFDVSHMLQSRVYGKDRVNFMESLVVSDLQGMKDNQGTLTVYTSEKGGIIDDLIVTKTNDYLFVVSNAGCADKDLAHVQNRLQGYRRAGGDAHLEVITDHALIAVQGPGSARVLQQVVDCDLNKLLFMTTVVTSVCGVPNCRVTRCGYTGEDGVEMSVPDKNAREIVETILASKEDEVRLAGLGARDTLRLEAGLCLYGNDIDESTTPVEAGLSWTIGKRRRTSDDFPGSKVILKQLADKPTRRRVGLKSTGPPARSHASILDQSGEQIGEVTSGCPSPCLNFNIGMGYVTSEHSKAGSPVLLEVRKKVVEAQVVKMPFITTRYFTPK